jgi:hypothetical protein
MSMMKLFMLSTLSSVMAISSALAADTSTAPLPAPTSAPAPVVTRGGGGDHDRQVVRCLFAGPKGTDCKAIAILSKHDDAPASSNFDDSMDGDSQRARLFVSCGGTTVYNDGARVRDKDDLTIVSAIPAPPALAFEKQHDHDGEVQAWLDLGDDTRLPGRCEFRHGDDDDGDGEGI